MGSAPSTPEELRNLRRVTVPERPIKDADRVGHVYLLSCAPAEHTTLDGPTWALLFDLFGESEGDRVAGVCYQLQVGSQLQRYLRTEVPMMETFDVEPGDGTCVRHHLLGRLPDAGAKRPHTCSIEISLLGLIAVQKLTSDLDLDPTTLSDGRSFARALGALMDPPIAVPSDEEDPFSIAPIAIAKD